MNMVPFPYSEILRARNMTKNHLYQLGIAPRPSTGLGARLLTGEPRNALAALAEQSQPRNALAAEYTTLFGKGGATYEFEVKTIGGDLSDCAGVYVMATVALGASILLGRSFDPQYIGETNSFRDRVTYGHEKMAGAKRLGVTHILIWRAPDSRLVTRETVETDLRHRYDPPLNRQGLRGVF